MITDAECGVVVMVRVTVCELAPGVIGFEGEKEAAVPVGGGDVVNVMGKANVPPPEGATVRLNTADWPAVTVTGAEGGVMLKSSTTNCNVDAVPPPGL